MWLHLHLRLILLDTVWGKIGGRRIELNRQGNTKRQVKIRTLTGKGWRDEERGSRNVWWIQNTILELGCI